MELCAVAGPSRTISGTPSSSSVSIHLMKFLIHLLQSDGRHLLLSCGVVFNSGYFLLQARTHLERTELGCFVALCRYNSTNRGWASPAGWNVSGNVILNCTKRVCLDAAYWLYPNITNHAKNNAMCDDELANWTNVSKEPFMNGLETIVDATWAQFPEATGTGFEFINPLLRFDTREMGLRCDEFRRSLPSSAIYRPWVKAAFADVPSSPPPGQKYTPTGAAARAKVRTGRALVLNFTQPCPPLTPTDCESIWVAWGECQADGQQMWRYTIEKEPVLGGKACQHEDGYTHMVSC
eukprot:COSAG02_NODE_2747_length_8108_cov_3.195405_5_plen_294_part_00